jgi:hypothetical protein
MTTLRAVLTTLCLASVCAGCGQSPTSAAVPDQPLYDGGGHTFGGGNRSVSSSTTAAAPLSQDAAETGGHTFGGGD